jgi:hypothetical protein
MQGSLLVIGSALIEMMILPEAYSEEKLEQQQLELRVRRKAQHH